MASVYCSIACTSVIPTKFNYNPDRKVHVPICLSWSQYNTSTEFARAGYVSYVLDEEGME